MSAARPVTLDDKYREAPGEIYLSAMQALVRVLLQQAWRDRARGLNTGGFVTGYRGSPVAGLDRELERAGRLLEEQRIRFEPGLNEELAATACWGTQQVPLFPQPRVAGVYALWYAKNPGLDRASDAIKHASHAGTSRHGGVLAVAGDDHLAKSSAFGHQSEYGFVDCLMPVLAPSSVREIVEFGLFGWALSRYCGSWVGFKLAGSICESSATVPAAFDAEYPEPTDFVLPPDGVHLRWPDDPAAMEYRAKSVRLPAAQAFARAAGIDRSYGARGPARLGLVAPGRAYGQLRQAFLELGLAESDLARLGVRVCKPALVWPVEPERMLEFARGLDTVLVVEDKRPLVEDQLKVLLFDRLRRDAPAVIGKRDERGQPLLPESGEVEAFALAAAIARRLEFPPARIDELAARAAARPPAPGPVRTPYFCSGCPHNTSTKVPDGGIVIGGIGCHTLAMGMQRGMVTFTHMGGEGASWLGIAPYTDLAHVFQNMGDGTYQHSGYLGIRAAVAAGATVTFKILYNDAVAMTGGQRVEGLPSVPRMTRQLAAEGVGRIAVVTDDPDRYDATDSFAGDVTVHHRDALEEVQRTLAKTPGVSALVYDQTCAAEKRRRRKAGRYPDPPKRALINERVCEDCGDCGVQSNCVSLVPVATAFGRKRQVDQASCNKDYSCVKGFCPSFVTVEGGQLRKRAPRVAGDVPEPPHGALAVGEVRRVLVAGIGGTGVVTVSAVVGMAARLDGLVAATNDVTGMAQKGGPVLAHLQLAADADAIASEKIPPGRADVLLALDTVVATMPDAALRVASDTQALVNTDLTETGAFARSREAAIDGGALVDALRARVGAIHTLPANRAAIAAAGDPVAAGLLVLGNAVQRGWLPLRVAALEQAIRLNGVAVEQNLAAFAWGRRLALDPAALAALGVHDEPELTLDATLERYGRELAAYQDARYASRWRALIDDVRAAESRTVPGASDLTRAVADAAFRLMAYKDEYEVARLQLDPAFRARIDAMFEGDYRVRHHLAPPLLARRDPITGVPRKIEFGGAIRPVFHVLRAARRLRGTWLDPFGRTDERRMERRLVEEYFAIVAHVVGKLTPGNHASAVRLARWADGVRGYGHVKQRFLAAAEQERDRALAEWRSATERA
jgi:indolepyruvate ferredoxin oxidoreductase